MASVGATVASTEAGELDGIDEFDETEDDETGRIGVGRYLDRRRPAGQVHGELRRGEGEWDAKTTDPVDANDELWGLD